MTAPVEDRPARTRGPAPSNPAGVTRWLTAAEAMAAFGRTSKPLYWHVAQGAVRFRLAQGVRGRVYAEDDIVALRERLDRVRPTRVEHQRATQRAYRRLAARYQKAFQLLLAEERVRVLEERERGSPGTAGDRPNISSSFVEKGPGSV